MAREIDFMPKFKVKTSHFIVDKSFLRQAASPALFAEIVLIE